MDIKSNRSRRGDAKVRHKATFMSRRSRTILKQSLLEQITSLAAPVLKVLFVRLELCVIGAILST